MTPSRTTRVLFLASMFALMAVVLMWAGWIGWREWPRWRVVRAMRAAVEANEPGRFLDAIERVDSLGVAAAAADEIAPLRQHPDPRVRMYAVIALTVLRPRGQSEARELIALFDDPDEDIAVRCTAAPCLVLFGDEQIRLAFPSLRKAMTTENDPRRLATVGNFWHLGREDPMDLSTQQKLTNSGRPGPNTARREVGEFLLKRADRSRLESR